MSTWFSRLLLIALPLSKACSEETFAALVEVLAWSYSLTDPSTTGTMPSRGFYGEHWPANSQRAAWANDNTPIAGGYCLIVIQLCGDWKFLKELLRLEVHYGRDVVC